MEAERRGPVNDVEQLLDGIPSLAGQERHVTLLPGGLTNRNYRVRTSAGLDVVVRHSSPQTGLLGVDRAAEHANSVAAAAAGVGAPVIDYVPALNVLVVQFLPGRTYADDDVARNLPRLAAALRRLHAGPPFRGRFDMVELQRSYLAICTERGFDIPSDYLQWAPYAARIAAAFRVSPEPLVPCHNDLLAANFLDDGGDVRIIDYEYSGMNEPSFELGNLIAEAQLGRSVLADLCTAYYGRRDDALIARAELWGVLARYGWTLWGMIQRATSSIEFDFWEWSMVKYDAARAAFADPGFEALCEQVANR